MLVNPATRNTVKRVSKEEAGRQMVDRREWIPLDDEGDWALPGPPRANALRPDVLEGSPAMAEIDFKGLTYPEVREFASAHLLICRWWLELCGDEQLLAPDKIREWLVSGGVLLSVAI